ncbi:MAG: proton-conducting transporter membrane subunit [Candidatus Saliniplasma sp.]
MIPFIVALPMLFAFLFIILVYLDVDRIYREGIFLIGVLSPLPIFIFNLNYLPTTDVIGGWSRIAGVEIAVDNINFFFLLAAFIVFVLVALYSLSHFDRYDEGVSKHSKFFLILILYGGILGSFVSKDLFNFAVYLEITSLSAIILVSSSREDGAKFASFRYLMLYLISSVFLIFAIGIIYVKTGYLNFYLVEENLVMTKEIKFAITVAFVALITKAGIFPLHFWLPEAHSKADTPVSALLSGVTVKVPVFGMVLFLRYTPIGFLTFPLLLVSFGSIFFGIFMALFEKDVKRFLAYSTVSQMGFILVGIGTLNIFATGVYVLGHAVVKAGLFMSIGILIDTQGRKKIEELSFNNKTFLMVTIVLLALGIGGISPFLGGYAKYTVLNGLSKWGTYLFYIGSVGTLTIFIRLIYELFDSDFSKRIHISFEEVIPFIIVLLTIIIGLYYQPGISITDVLLIITAVIVFFTLRYTGLLNYKIPSYYGDDVKDLAGQINLYTIVFVLVNVLFLFLVLYGNIYGGLLNL